MHLSIEDQAFIDRNLALCEPQAGAELEVAKPKRSRKTAGLALTGVVLALAASACTPRPPQPVDGLLGGGAGGQGCVRTWNNAHTSTFWVC